MNGEKQYFTDVDETLLETVSGERSEIGEDLREWGLGEGDRIPSFEATSQMVVMFWSKVFWIFS